MGRTSDIITDSRVFNEEYTPHDLLHRHSEHKEISNELQPAARGLRANDIVIHGRPGVGKTLTAKVVCSHLYDEARVHYHRIGCTSATQTGILYQAVTGHPRDVYVNPNASTEYLLRTLQDIVDDPYVLILDEADDLPETDVLQVLSHVPLVSVIIICHDYPEWTKRLDETLKSRLSLHPVKLNRYDTDELTDILVERRKRGLIHGIVSDDQLREIADRTAGVARLAIQTLHAAATFADERGHSEVHAEDIDDGVSRAKRWIRQSSLQSLGFHHHVVYALVHEASIAKEDDEISGSVLQERYQEVAPDVYEERECDPVGARRVRQFLEKLATYDLIDHDGVNRWRTYWVKDMDVESPVELPPGISERNV